MRRAVSAMFFLAMVPFGFLATEVQTAGYRTSNAQDIVAAKKAQHGRLRLRGGGGDDDDSPGAPSPTTPPSVANVANDMETLLDLHNEARCLHNADALTYSGAVANSAMAHASVLSSSCGDFYHSDSEDRNGYGENLYLCWGSGSGSCYAPEKAMNSLYDDEIKADSVTGYGGHATQILWKSTTELGCAVATCNKDSYLYVYLVCQYNPPGNYMAIVEQEVELPGTSC